MSRFSSTDESAESTPEHDANGTLDTSAEKPRRRSKTRRAKVVQEDKPAEAATDTGDWDSPQWAMVAAELIRRFDARPLQRVCSDWQVQSPRDAGSCLRSGLAIAQNAPLEPLQIALTDLAAGIDPGRRLLRSIHWADAADEMNRKIDFARSPGKIDPVLVTEAVCWAYALPALIERVSEPTWKSLCQSLDALARHCLSFPELSSVGRLIGGCELPMVLRLRLGELASESLAKEGLGGLHQWCAVPEVSLANAIRGGKYARLVIASVLRQRQLAEIVAKVKVKRKELGTAIDLACWAAAFTRFDGTAVFSSLTRAEVRDDVVTGGLFDAMKTLAPKLLGPAVDATVGVSHTGGKLAWAVSLPESLWHSELAGAATMLPEWDVRRGRTHVDYSGEDFLVEVEYGRGIAIGGKWEAMIEVDGAEQAPSGPWTHVCEYSDDDAQYLEFEQGWTGGVRLQRQIMLLRDDRCVMLADAVLRESDQPTAMIRYVGRTPLSTTLTAAFETDTNEIWLKDSSEKRRVLALSLQTNEWRVGASAAKIEITEDHHLKLQATSKPPRDNGGNVFAPLWFDFQQRRFDRPRTYRQLTVGDELRIVDQDEAVSHRIQMGSEHWVTYRSLRGERTRTFLGKHLVADFYCARFHPGDGSLEDLLTVGDHDEDIARAEAEAKEKST